MSLQTPEKIRKLQKALHAKAKEVPDYRFYLLYDKVYRADILQFAYRCCRRNGGAAGVDGQKFENIESYLGEAAESGVLPGVRQTVLIVVVMGREGNHKNHQSS